MQQRTLEIECASGKATLYESKLRNGGSDTCVLFEGNRLTPKISRAEKQQEIKSGGNTLRDLTCGGTLVVGNTETGGEDELSKEEYAEGDEQSGHYLEVQASAVVNSRDFERVVHSCGLPGKVASDMDSLAQLVVALADRVLKQET